MKRDHLSKSPVPFSLIASRNAAETSIPTTEYSQMSDRKKKKKLNPLAEKTFQKSISLLFLPARSLPSIVEGWRQIPAAAQHPLSTSDPSSPQSLPRGQIKRADLAAAEAAVPRQGHGLCAPRHLKVYLWPETSLSSLAFSAITPISWPSVAVALFAFHFTCSHWTQFAEALIQLEEQKNNTVMRKGLHTSALQGIFRKRPSLDRFWAVVLPWAQPRKP